MTDFLAELREQDAALGDELQAEWARRREELAPVFELIAAAAGGRREARDELEELCRAWEVDPQHRPWTQAFRLLADGADASGLPGLVGAQGVVILMPLLQQIKPPGL